MGFLYNQTLFNIYGRKWNSKSRSLEKEESNYCRFKLTRICTKQMIFAFNLEGDNAIKFRHGELNSMK